MNHVQKVLHWLLQLQLHHTHNHIHTRWIEGADEDPSLPPPSSNPHHPKGISYSFVMIVGSPLYSLGLVENMRWNFFLQRFFGCGGTSELVRCTYLPRCPSYSLQKYFVSGSINCPFPTKSTSLSLFLLFTLPCFCFHVFEI